MADSTLLKTLVAAGLGSRRIAADAIKHERIKLNGNIVTAFNQPVDPETDRITIDDRPVNLTRESRIYIVMNKPAGVLATTRDDRGRATVIDLLPERFRQMQLYPVGRLDKASRGLLLLTNDGALTYRLTHPKFEKEKEYIVILDKPMHQADLRAFASGLELEDGITYPAVIQEITSAMPTYSITLHEGRKRQLRRMFQNLGYHVLDLKRVRLGPLHLQNLPEGHIRMLSTDEIAAIFPPASPQP
jgi:23S rRNA pseudouridine2605 synthase